MNEAPKRHVHRHSDGSIWAKGWLLDGVMTGFWEWFRKDGVRMRSGYFDDGRQVGTWTTYDRTGAVYKVTMVKPKTVAPKKKATKKAAKGRT